MAKVIPAEGSFGAGSIGDSVIKGRTAPDGDQYSGKGRGIKGDESLNDSVVKPGSLSNSDGPKSKDTPSNKGDFNSVVSSGGGSFGQK